MPDVLSPRRLAITCLCGNDEPTKIKRYFYPRTNAFLGILCDVCNSEWLIDDAVNSLPKNETVALSLKGCSLQQYDLPTCEYSSNFPVDARTKISNVSQLKEGDHFSFDRPYYIWHHGIVYNIDEDNGRFEAIHWHKTNWSEETKIQRSWLYLQSERGDLYRIDYDVKVTEASSTELVIARAFSLIGQTGYNFLKKNCEHFASFCKVGIGNSIQTNSLVNKVKRTVASVLSSELTKNISIYICKRATAVLTAEAIELALKQTNVVGGVIVIAFEGVFMILDLSKIFDQRKSGKISYKEFMKSSVVRITEALFVSTTAIGMGIGAAAVGEAIGEAIGSAIGTAVLPGIGTVIGFISGVAFGALGAVLGHLLGNMTGDFIGYYIAKTINKDDRPVKAITDLQEGDHIVLYANLVHPRCHAIVLDHDSESMVLITRNLYEKGVVLEWIKFSKPIYKVIYTENEMVSVKETIQRADSKFTAGNQYNLITNNCKHFAQWCKQK